MRRTQYHPDNVLEFLVARSCWSYMNLWKVNWEEVSPSISDFQLSVIAKYHYASIKEQKPNCWSAQRVCLQVPCGGEVVSEVQCNISAKFKMPFILLVVGNGKRFTTKCYFVAAADILNKTPTRCTESMATRYTSKNLDRWIFGEFLNCKSTLWVKLTTAYIFIFLGFLGS